MPIRMRPDDQGPERRPNQPNQPDQSSRPTAGGKLPMWALIAGILAIIKKPQWTVPILVIFAVVYFYGCPSAEDLLGDLPYEYQAENQAYSFGAEFDQQKYDQSMVFEPLAVGSTTIPSSVSLEQYTPRILHQGSQGSCSGWACAYAARTVSYAQATGNSPDNVAFSPSFLYNQIALPRCQGAYLKDAMDAMQRVGSLPFKDFGYTDQTCQIYPDRADQGDASRYRIKGYTRLTQGANRYGTNINAVKQHLAQGSPVIIGAMVGQSFQHGMIGKDVWYPTRSEYAGQNLGGHAMCVVGYDDRKAGGAFRVMNSWGERWGDQGYVWIRYDDFQRFVQEAYAPYPEGRADSRAEKSFQARFALVDNASNQAIPLRQTGEISFATERPIPKGTAFKMAITNNTPAYIYLFGMETNGSAYTLFPYSSKHSPYCGITGTRVFPRDFSLVPDDIGNTDYFAIVLSKKPLEYEQIKDQMNRSRQSSFMMRMVETMANDFIPGCDFSVDGTVGLDCDTQGKDVLGMIVKIDKI